tara:strand:- start:238 stop:579 length:342 start_codon:yes stop_codon:yes gene_type:complete
MKFTGTVKDGKLTLTDKSGFKRLLSDIEGDVWLEIKLLPKSRTAKQNAYYRAMLKEVGNELGYTEQELHQTLKEMLDVESTKNLTVEEFSDYLDKITIHFAKIGVQVLDPFGR